MWACLLARFPAHVQRAPACTDGTRLGGVQLIKVVDRPDDDKLKHSCEILASQKSFVVYASSAQDKEEWLRHLLHALHEVSVP